MGEKQTPFENWYDNSTVPDKLDGMDPTIMSSNILVQLAESKELIQKPKSLVRETNIVLNTLSVEVHTISKSIKDPADVQADISITLQIEDGKNKLYFNTLFAVKDRTIVMLEDLMPQLSFDEVKVPNQILFEVYDVDVYSGVMFGPSMNLEH